jgi:predicted secreted Zn-dependent protease
MATDQDLQRLHDKATRGLALAEEEHARLAAWYAQLDSDEDAALSGTPKPQTVTALQAQVETVTVQLLNVTQRIQATTAENDRLRREIAALQEQVAQRLKAQPA